MERFSYEGAKTGRRTEGWATTGTSANAEIQTSLAKLRERSRDLIRNNPHASKAVAVLTANSIGTGIIPQAKTGNELLNRQINDLFSIWQEEADADDQLEFYGLQKMIARTVFESGEALVRFRRRLPQDGMLSVPMQIQVLEADYLDLLKNQDLGNGNFILQGVEFNALGTRVAYWLFPNHPGEVMPFFTKGFVSKRIPASEVLHIYEKQRPGQVRGVPWRAASIMLAMRDLADYAEAELVRKKIESCFAAFVTQPEGADGPVLGPSSTDVNQNRIEAFEPGMVEYLKPGEEVNFGNPQGSGAGAAEYERQRLHDVAAGWGITYEQMTGDLSQVNYSSFKAGHNEFRALVEDFRWNTFIPMLCVPVWKRFILDAFLDEKIGEANYSAKWTPPKFQSIDATKDAEAALAKVRAGFLTLPEAIAEEGYDPDDQFNEIEATNKILDAKGIILDSDPRKGSKVQGGNTNGQAKQAAA